MAVIFINPDYFSTRRYSPGINPQNEAWLQLDSQLTLRKRSEDLIIWASAVKSAGVLYVSSSSYYLWCNVRTSSETKPRVPTWPRPLTRLLCVLAAILWTFKVNRSSWPPVYSWPWFEQEVRGGWGWERVGVGGGGGGREGGWFGIEVREFFAYPEVQVMPAVCQGRGAWPVSTFDLFIIIIIIIIIHPVKDRKRVPPPKHPPETNSRNFINVSFKKIKTFKFLPVVKVSG